METLIARVRDGDPAATDELKARWSGPAYRTAYACTRDETLARQAAEATLRELFARLAADPETDACGLWLSAVAEKQIDAHRLIAPEVAEIGREIEAELLDALIPERVPDAGPGQDRRQTPAPRRAGFPVRPPHMRARTVPQMRPLQTPAAARRAQEARTAPSDAAEADSPLAQYLNQIAGKQASPQREPARPPESVPIAEAFPGSEPAAASATPSPKIMEEVLPAAKAPDAGTKPPPPAAPNPAEHKPVPPRAPASAARPSTHYAPPPENRTTAPAGPRAPASAARPSTHYAPPPENRAPASAARSSANAAPPENRAAAPTGPRAPASAARPSTHYAPPPENRTTAQKKRRPRKRPPDASLIALYALTGLLGLILLWFLLGILAGRGVLTVPDLGFRWFNQTVAWIF